MAGQSPSSWSRDGDDGASGGPTGRRSPAAAVAAAGGPSRSGGTHHDAAGFADYVLRDIYEAFAGSVESPLLLTNLGPALRGVGLKISEQTLARVSMEVDFALDGTVDYASFCVVAQRLHPLARGGVDDAGAGAGAGGDGDVLPSDAEAFAVVHRLHADPAASPLESPQRRHARGDTDGVPVPRLRQLLTTMGEPLSPAEADEVIADCIRAGGREDVISAHTFAAVMAASAVDAGPPRDVRYP